MKVTWSIVESFILVVSVVALAHTGTRLLRLSRQIKDSTVSAAILPVDAPLRTSGVDIWGRLFVPKTPDPGQDWAVFVFRSSTYQADLAYWRSVWHGIYGKRDLQFLAFCNDRACVDWARRTPPQEFTVLAYGQIVSLEHLFRADKRGAALVVNHNGQIKEAIPWRDATAVWTVSHLRESR